MKRNNIFYFREISSIGGIETFFYELAKKYKEYDITIVYDNADKEQLSRLKKYVRCVKNVGQEFECEKVFFNFNTDIIDKVKAKEYIQIAHGDYKAIGIEPNTNSKITKYIGVSELVCKTYKETTGYDTELCYNPITIEKPRKVLNLISATRLSLEKGKERMKKFGEMLDKANIPYIWTVFTNDKNTIDNPNIIYMKPRLDIRDYIANADYLVQLSDNEGYCYSIVESLCLGTPVIATKIPVLKELKLNDTNSFLLDFDLSNADLKAIYKGLPKFEYKPMLDKWDKYLVKGKSTYQEELKEMVKVRCIEPYKDLELKESLQIGDIREINKIRAEYLINENVIEYVEE